MLVYFNTVSISNCIYVFLGKEFTQVSKNQSNVLSKFCYYYIIITEPIYSYNSFRIKAVSFLYLSKYVLQTEHFLSD